MNTINFWNFQSLYYTGCRNLKSTAKGCPPVARVETSKYRNTALVSCQLFFSFEEGQLTTCTHHWLLIHSIRVALSQLPYWRPNHALLCQCLYCSLLSLRLHADTTGITSTSNKYFHFSHFPRKILNSVYFHIPATGRRHNS